ncbi:polyketide synthase, partial [Burkholderia anthina]|uniref:beta-ketoacyl [acyl carrier protein] synthase domain-containing protein n=1 Tax=Burkholderia anthina TaxID=179879 RepID=UPI0015890A51
TGGVLDDIDKFDPRYFNISQRDAELMSPEVRLFLQVGVEAFEDAGYSREQMRQRYDGDVGVLVGTMSNHYNLLGFQNMLTSGSRAIGSYTGTLPNMLSYFYGFTGPSIFLDTMCSAASTCIDQGVWMLRTRQCRMVLAGGVNLLLHPQNLISSSQEHFTSKSSDVIRSYGLGTDGTILGEGLGAVLLKPLVEA